MKLKEYLANRRAEIDAEIKALKAELAEIRIAEDALSGAPTGKTVVASPKGPAVVREGSIKDWVLKALAHMPQGGETEQIITAISLLGGPLVPRNSMTPQLSRLKADELLELHGRLWRLAQKDETPGVSPPDASEPEWSFSDDGPFRE